MRRTCAVSLLFLFASPSFAQTRVDFSQLRNLAQISPAPVAPALGGTQLALNQAKWPGGFWDVGTIVDMIAQANTGRVFLYSFQGATVYGYGRTFDFKCISGRLTPQNPDHPDMFSAWWDKNVTSESLAWFRLTAPYYSSECQTR